MNPSGFDTDSVELSLVTSESTKTKNLQIPPKGMVEVDVGEFFEDVEPFHFNRQRSPVTGHRSPVNRQRSTVNRTTSTASELKAQRRGHEVCI